MFVRVFSFTKISCFSSLSTKSLFKMSTVMGSGGYFQFLVLNLTTTTWCIAPTVQGDAPCLSTGCRSLPATRHDNPIS